MWKSSSYPLRISKENVSTKFKDQKVDSVTQWNSNTRDVLFMEIHELNLFQLLSLVELPNLQDAPIKDPDFFIDPITIPGVNHHFVNPKSPVVTGLMNSLESDEQMFFVDLNFSGVLYEIGGPSNGPKLVSFTGAKDIVSSYNIPYDNPGEKISSITGCLHISSNNIISDIVSIQKKHKLRLSPNEGLHRLFVYINHAFKVSSGDQQDKKEKLLELLNRKVKLVLLFPKPNQPIPNFFDILFQSSLHISSIRKVLAPHTFWDSFKNCFHIFRNHPKFIVTDTLFITEKGPDLTQALKLVDILFMSYMKYIDRSRWEKQDESNMNKRVSINEHLGLLQVGKRQFINSVTKSKQPRSSKIYFMDKQNRLLTELSHQEICLYCLLIVLCYSNTSCDVIGRQIGSPTEEFFSSYHRMSKSTFLFFCVNCIYYDSSLLFHA